jgi:hypothetical protein
MPELFIYKFKQTATEIWLEDLAVVTKFSGGELPPLAYPAITVLGCTLDMATLLLFGGLRLPMFQPSNNIYIVTYTFRNKKVHVEPYLESPPEDDMFANVKLQHGDIPSPRWGATITRVSSDLLCIIGGTQLKKRNISQTYSDRIFRMTDSDPYMYMLNPQNMTWSKKVVGDVACRAFHTATLINKSLMVCGGYQVQHRRP